MPIRLREVAEEIQMQSTDGVSVVGYIHKRTGEIVQLTEDLQMLAEQDDLAIARLQGWEKEAAQQARQALHSPDYIPLPSPDDLNEYRLMETFAAGQANRAHAERLLDAMGGKGAFRRFKDTASGLGLLDDWYRFRDQAYEVLAAEFLDAAGIGYER